MSLDNPDCGGFPRHTPRRWVPQVPVPHGVARQLRLPVLAVNGRLPDRAGNVVFGAADLIPDLDDIREGARAGATAYQKPEGGIPKTDLEEEVQASLGKADSAVQPDDILSGGKVKSDLLPSYVDDVIEAANYASLPSPGEEGKIYVTLDTNKTYRWGGSEYVEISNPDLTNYIQKKSGATAGNLAALTQDGNLADSGKKPSDFATATQGAKADTAVQPAAIAGFVDGAEYDAEYGDPPKPTILLKHGSEVVATVDAAAFVIDGMVSDVKIVGGDLVVTFNTDSGKQPISIPLTSIFNPDNYYDRTATDGLLAGKASKSDVDPLLFAQYYPEGNVKSAAEFTAGIKYDTPDTTNRTITVKPFCFTGDPANDNSGLVGRVVIPPFVDGNGNGNGYISDDGTRFKVVGVASGGMPYDYNTNLTAIIAPNTVTTIGGGVFFDCIALTSISFPSATTIGDGAFADCTSLTSISFPSATTIGNSAFYSCTSLTSVDFGDKPRSSVPTLGADAFSRVPTSCKIIVPYTQYDAWKAADGWRDLPQEFVRHAEKADKPATFTTGNLAKFDSNGNPIDSGTKPSDFQSALTGQQLANIAAVSDALAFDAMHSYAAGDPVVYNGTLYTFTAAHTGAWTGNDVSTVDIIARLAGKANRAANPTAGNLAALDAQGNPTNSGWTAGDLARYALTSKTISNNAVALDDRADNYVDARTLGSSDSLDIDFPALVDGKSRDFVLAVECGANPPTISYAAFVTIMAEDASTLTPEQGMNIYAFTELKTNMFLASRKTVGTVVVNTPESADQLLLAMQKRGIDTTGITDFGGVETALGLGDTDTPQDAIDAVMN